MLFDAASYLYVAFHSPTAGRDGTSSCYATSFSVTTCELQYHVNFVKPTYFRKHENVCYSKRCNLYVTLNVSICLAVLLLCEFV